MALDVQIRLVTNHVKNEKIAQASLVNLQKIDFNAFCDYMALGSSVTAADVMAVMKRLETVIPMLMNMNAKVQISPSGITVRPSVKGTVSQSDVTIRLQHQAKEHTNIDVNRSITESDLTTDYLSAHILLDYPKALDQEFSKKAEFRRVNKK